MTTLADQIRALKADAIRDIGYETSAMVALEHAADIAERHDAAQARLIREAEARGMEMAAGLPRFTPAQTWIAGHAFCAAVWVDDILALAAQHRAGADVLKAAAAREAELRAEVKQLTQENAEYVNELFAVSNERDKHCAEAARLSALLDEARAALKAFDDFDQSPVSVKRPDIYERKVRQPILTVYAKIGGT
jgi:hypothetical protein